MGERWFSDDELTEMSRPTMDRAIEAIEAGDLERAIEYTVDAETYLPLTQRFSMDRGGGVTVEVLTEYDVYEELPLDDDTGRLLALDPHPGAECSEFAHELTERDLGFPNPCRK